MKKSATARLFWDRLGIGVSTVCAIHCLTVPVTVSLLPLWPVLDGHQEWIHPVVLLLLLPIVFFAIRRSHFDRQITTFLFTGLLLVTGGWLLGHYLFGIWVESFLTIAGSGLLIFGHWKNYRHHRRCNNSRHRHHPVAEQIIGEETK